MRALPRRAILALCLIGAALAISACGPQEPHSVGGPPDMRRLTEEQYHNIIADVFGPTIAVGGRFDPLLRTDGLLAVGARSARITPSGFEQYYGLAQSIAAQVTSPENRDNLLSCQPAAANAADDSCATAFFAEAGRLIYRQPLTAAELAVPVKAAHDVAATTGDFYQGIAYGLAGMMMTPNFLFVIDTTEPDPNHAGAIRLTGFAKAARLSFLLWNTTPDDALLSAAARGELHTADGLGQQVDRLLASPKLDAGVRAFFADFLEMQKFETLEKDPIIYPAFNLRAADDSREQVLRTITAHLIADDADYRDLFTTRRTFITATLARIYRVPVVRPDGGWTAYEFPPGDIRAGLITQVGFAALNSHPGRSSPTLRGRAIRELLLCQKVPDPPGNVDFSAFTDPNSPHKTARERLTAHRTAEACAGCHKMTDPIGLGLENLDGAGVLRSTENGSPIDTSGDLDGVPYKDAAGLGKALHDNPAVTSCLVNRLFAYAVGRTPDRADRDAIAYFEAAFANEKFRLPQLLRRIATSQAFFQVSEPANASRSAERAGSGMDPSKESRS